MTILTFSLLLGPGQASQALWGLLDRARGRGRPRSPPHPGGDLGGTAASPLGRLASPLWPALADFKAGEPTRRTVRSPGGAIPGVPWPVVPGGGACPWGCRRGSWGWCWGFSCSCRGGLRGTPPRECAPVVPPAGWGRTRALRRANGRNQTPSRRALCGSRGLALWGGGLGGLVIGGEAPWRSSRWMRRGASPYNLSPRAIFFLGGLRGGAGGGVCSGARLSGSGLGMPVLLGGPPG